MNRSLNGLKKRRRIRLVIAAALLLAASTALIGYAFRDGIQFFRTPSQVAVTPPGPDETFRIGGIVEPGSIRRSGSRVEFHVTDGDTAIPVTYTGITPDLFREGEGVIATGRLVGGTVQATEVLARHDEEYTPRELAGMALP